jgi:hypothetical protein
MRFTQFFISLVCLFLTQGLFSFTAPPGYPVPAVSGNPELSYSRSLYSMLHLADNGLSFEAFDLGLKGMRELSAKGRLSRTDLISIADLSQSSCKKRLYVIDLERREVVIQTYVAHGRNSGEEFAKSFSNQPSSYQTSLGFYTTMNTYDGIHGLSLQLKGEEHGINDQAFDRAIVMHGADYVCASFIKQTGRLGRSQGCPAVPVNECESIVKKLKSGSCLFIYYPDKDYLMSSQLLND